MSTGSFNPFQPFDLPNEWLNKDEMKYFTKYIPVEEEIKEGDWFIDEYKNIYKCIKKDNGHTWSSGYSRSINIALSKKVKLFLCSRDIQVGDTVRDKTGKEFIFTKDVAKFPKCYDLVYKVIGEVSPEAMIFVKEGMEFDEYEEWWYSIKFKNFFFKYIEGDINREEYNDSLKREENVKRYIKLKCSQCNTFH